MLNKTYLLSTQGKSDYKNWIKKLTDIAAKETGVAATVSDDGEPVLMLFRSKDSVPEPLRSDQAELYAIRVTVEIREILLRELDEIDKAISLLDIKGDELADIYEGIEESIISFLKTRFQERDQILRRAVEENNFELYDYFQKKEKETNKEDKPNEDSTSNQQS